MINCFHCHEDLFYGPYEEKWYSSFMANARNRKIYGPVPDNATLCGYCLHNHKQYSETISYCTAFEKSNGVEPIPVYAWARPQLNRAFYHAGRP